MNGNGHIATEDLALFALLLLSEEEEAAVREHVQACALCREELRQVRKDLALYALTVEPVEVAPELRERFLTWLDKSPSSPGKYEEPVAGPVAGFDAASREAASARPGRTSESTQQHSGSRPALVSGSGLEPRAGARAGAGKVLPWLGWAAAAAMLVAAAGLRQDRNTLQAALARREMQTAKLQAQADEARHVLDVLTDPAAIRVNLAVPKAPVTPTARATYEQKSGTLLLLASNLAPIDARKAYELWLIPANGGKPVAAGTFLPDAHGNGSLLVPALPGAVAVKAFGITVEPAGGSATPTLPILLAGAPA